LQEATVLVLSLVLLVAWEEVAGLQELETDGAEDLAAARPFQELVARGRQARVLRVVAFLHRPMLALAVEGPEKLDKAGQQGDKKAAMVYRPTSAAHPVFMLEVEALAISSVGPEALAGQAEAVQAREMRQVVLVAPTQEEVVAAEVPLIMMARTLAGPAW
jgi:hypothetical protein